MNYKLIMLPNPILISDEEIKEGDRYFDATDKEGLYPIYRRSQDLKFYSGCVKVVAGIEGLPKLDLSAIAEEIGWIDVEKLAWETLFSKWDSRDIIEQKEQYALKAFIEGFKVAQSLNEKKYSLEDAKLIWKAGQEYWRTSGRSVTFEELIERRQQLLSKPKEYSVEVDMEHCEYCDGDGVYIDNDSNRVSCEVHAVHTKSKPKITDNTIKVLRVIN